MSNGIAETILNQLGGRMMLTLTGTKKVVFGENYLLLQIGTNAKRVRIVRITLNDRDLYDVKFMKSNLDVIATESDIFAEMLMDRFEANTELYVTMKARA